jgi:hypothetical protein
MSVSGSRPGQLGEPERDTIRDTNWRLLFRPASREHAPFAMATILALIRDLQSNCGTSDLLPLGQPIEAGRPVCRWNGMHVVTRVPADLRTGAA